ncbi:MAG TPA: hypothetical protein VGL22_02595 [Terracidiphilus sp.]
MNMHNLVVSCLVAAYLAANVYAIVKMRVFELARSRKHLIVYGVPFILWGSVIQSDCHSIKATERALMPNIKQPVGPIYRHSAEQQRIHDTEDRGVRPDSKRQNQDDDLCVKRIPAQLSESRPYVFQEIRHRSSSEFTRGVL